MDIRQLLQWTDKQIFEKTGQHLDSLQQSILKGVLQNQNFHKIEEESGYSYDHVKAEGAKLWKLLSDIFQEDIKQGNVRCILDNIYNFGSQQIIGDNGQITICREPPQSPEDIEKRSPSSQVPNQTPVIDLTKAPELNFDYGRTSEISSLKEWILENQTRLITVYGLSGIGKTALILKLTSEIQTNFDYILYRSLNNVPKLITLKDELKQFFSQSQSNPLPEIIDYWRSYRCLVILDDVQNIFENGKLAGQYLTQYKDYSKFFTQIATSSHQSCLILISWEKPAEIETLESENIHTRTLQLNGLGEDAKKILNKRGLKDDNKWGKLIKLYQNHPTWLNIIASTIINLHEGSVSEFLKDEEELFLGDIEVILESQLARLSELELKVINWLAMQDEPIGIGQKPDTMEVSTAKFRHIIQSLTRRSLVEKLSVKEGVKFQLNAIYKIYVKSNYSSR